MEVITLSGERENEYEEFLLKSPNTLFFASNKYRTLIKSLLNCSDFYLLALKDNQIAGALPCMIIKNEKYGNVLNSLPYYGSNGAIIEHKDSDNVKDLLMSALKDLCKKQNCAASTVITSPLESDLGYYRSQHCDFVDTRRGMITHLPRYSAETEQELLNLFDANKRRDARKVMRSTVKVRSDNSAASFEFLYEVHLENMLAVGGKPKEKRFFEYVLHHLVPGVDYNIYLAELEGVTISALLIFYFNKTVEYFTPVIVSEYRTYQALTLIILRAMVDSAKRGFDKWNWGGTGLSQTGVYNFKKGFGATEYPYYYFTTIYDKSILKLEKSVILNEYSDFFVFPFNEASAMID